MLNSCSFIGNLGADPEVRSFSNGGKVANIRLAVTEKWKSKDGERKERTEWVSVTVTGDGLVGVVERYIKKGSKIYIQGKLQTRKYTDKDGNDKYATEVVVGMDGKMVMLDGPKESGSSGGGFSGSAPKSGGFSDDLDDDVPFVTCDMRLEGRVS